MSPQHKALLAAFQRGERLTVASAISRYGVYALSQRVGELKRDGHGIKGEMKTMCNGKRVKVYWMDI